MGFNTSVCLCDAVSLCPSQVSIRRDTMMEDAFAALARTGADLKARLIVTFINSAGLRCRARQWFDCAVAGWWGS